ncbi:MAG: hypothetical protein IKJ32_02190 [Clostridia bacterium]|nr:hypothetical protein [Clostridia bacterium]
MREGRLSGKVMPPMIEEGEGALERLKEIELLEISTEEKDLLFLIEQIAESKERSLLIKELEKIIESNILWPAFSYSKVILEKIERIMEIEKDKRLAEVANNLKQRIENNEIIL